MYQTQLYLNTKMRVAQLGAKEKANTNLYATIL